MDALNRLKALMEQPRKVLLTSHRNPDGDAIGSMLGLYHLLRKRGHEVAMAVPSAFPEFLDWMPGVDQILIHDDQAEACSPVADGAEVVFYLDFNDIERIDKLGELCHATEAFKVMIDHHLEPQEGIVDYMLSVPSASSTCELVWDFIHLMGWQDQIDCRVAECLFTGLLTDTGGFKYATSPKVYRLAAELVEKGVDDVVLQDRLFNSMTEKQLRLLGHALAHRMEILDEYHTGIITLTKKDYERFEIARGDTEGIVNYLLKLRNVKLAAFIHEQPTITKISLRSKGDLSVQEIAQKYFKGGGHKNASGGYSYIGLGPTVRKFKSVLPKIKDQLERVAELPDPCHSADDESPEAEG